jgi:thiamine biosynthesis lipoprotein
MIALDGASRLVVPLGSPTTDESFRALGTDVRLIATGAGARAAVARARAEILDYHARLSRFLPASEISALNSDRRAVVPASTLLRSAVQAGLWAARHSGGLVDPCLLDALEAAGYERPFEPRGAVPPPSGPPRSAAPDPASRWRAVAVDDRAGTIRRPPGVRLDLGGSGKGHVADLVARHFASLRAWVVDCGGDIRVGGAREIDIAHPLTSRPAATLRVVAGAVATSSVVARAWLSRQGRRVHHLLDPSTRQPAWTGLLSATALAPTTLHAETLAKVALLRGPDGAREVLARHGGLVVHAGGYVEAIGPLPQLAR